MVGLNFLKTNEQFSSLRALHSLKVHDEIERETRGLEEEREEGVGGRERGGGRRRERRGEEEREEGVRRKKERGYDREGGRERRGVMHLYDNVYSLSFLCYIQLVDACSCSAFLVGYQACLRPGKMILLTTICRHLSANK